MGKFKKLLVITLITIALSAGAAFALVKGVFSSDSNKETSAEEIAELSVDTDVITTNLSSNNFAIVQFNILLNDKKAKEELEKRTPEVRAVIISTLAGLTKEQLNGSEGISQLEAEILAKVNDVLESGQAKRVLVTEFKVQ